VTRYVCHGTFTEDHADGWIWLACRARARGDRRRGRPAMCVTDNGT
jgi:hypothetical protein